MVRPETPRRSPHAVSGSPYEAQFEKVWQVIHDKFYDARLNGVDWYGIRSKYRSQLYAAQSKLEFENLVNKMLSELHSSHTAYFTDDDVEFAMLPSVLQEDLHGHIVEHIGVMGRQDQTGYLVRGVLDGGPAQRAGIEAGDRILAADGKAFSTVGSFRGKLGLRVRISLLRPGGTAPRTIEVTPVRGNMLQCYLDATRQSAHIIDLDGRRIGYVHLWTMACPAFRELLHRLVLTKLYATDGLVLDLRDGYGGVPWGYGDVFFRPDVNWETSTHDNHLGVEHTGYAKPMVVLINDGTRSAKEFLTYQLHAAKRAVIVGTTTAGAFLGASAVKIGNDGLLELAELGLKLDGKRLEGNGVNPDIEVEPAHTYLRDDAQLAHAERILAKQIDAARRTPRWIPTRIGGT